MDTAFFIRAFGAFFALLNPFLVLPVFLQMTAGFSVPEQRRLAMKVAFYALTLAAVLLVTGEHLISFFGVTIDQFRIAGGLVVMQVAWSMLNGTKITSQEGSGSETDHMAMIDRMAFFPLTFPMIVGPGTIATIIVYTGQAKELAGDIAIGGILAVIIGIQFATLYFASTIGHALSQTMRVIMTRIMGMILLAIGVEMIAAGLKAVLPGLAGGS